MDVLMRYGFSIEEIKNMMDTNEEIEAIPDKTIYDLIDILGSIGCFNQHIKNIFYSNPFSLSRNTREIKKTIEAFKELEIDHIEILLDSNPYLLNINAKDIRKIRKQKEKEGYTLNEIKDYFYYHSNEIL